MVVSCQRHRVAVHPQALPRHHQVRTRVRCQLVVQALPDQLSLEAWRRFCSGSFGCRDAASMCWERPAFACMGFLLPGCFCGHKSKDCPPRGLLPGLRELGTDCLPELGQQRAVVPDRNTSTHRRLLCRHRAAQHGTRLCLGVP